jgi:uncharacterized UBP type Zn finger protein
MTQNINPSYIRDIVDMGFTEEQAQHALKMQGNNKELAVDFLLTGSSAIVPVDDSNMIGDVIIGNDAIV